MQVAQQKGLEARARPDQMKLELIAQFAQSTSPIRRQIASIMIQQDGAMHVSRFAAPLLMLEFIACPLEQGQRITAPWFEQHHVFQANKT
jgi:hypothetical protein